jgi:hypothetical protein
LICINRQSLVARFARLISQPAKRSQGLIALQYPFHDFGFGYSSIPNKLIPAQLPPCEYSKNGHTLRPD